MPNVPVHPSPFSIPTLRVVSTRKVAQLTGEYDREGWNGTGVPRFALNRTESRSGIRGTDLGVSFEHKGRLYFLFGDTWRVNQTLAQLNYDSIAWSADTDPSTGVHLTFLPEPPIVYRIVHPNPAQVPLRLPCIDHGGMNVPLDGVSWNDTMYVFFCTDYRAPPDGQHDGGTHRCVLARSDDDGASFVLRGDFSTDKFQTVSVERGVIHQAGAATGFAPGTEVLWIWGTGAFRRSDICLAVMPMNQLDTLGGVRYFAGNDHWSDNEADAVALFPAGDAGELSARWNPYLSHWLLLRNSGNPRGILLNSAAHPWGPWVTYNASADPSLQSTDVMTWWPTHRPDDVIARGAADRVAWARRSGGEEIGTKNEFLAEWKKLGFVVALSADRSRFAEVDRDDA
jgi:hypothetical protein